MGIGSNNCIFYKEKVKLMVESLKMHLSRGTLLENAFNQVVVINVEKKYVYDEGTTWDLAQIIAFFRKSKLNSWGVIGNAFKSWDIARKCFQPRSCHK